MPTQNTGVLDVFTDTLTHKRYVTDMVSYISPSDAPVWNYLQGANAESKFNIVALPGHKIEWLEDELRAIESGLAASITSVATSMTVTSGAGDYFRVGDVLIIDSERVWVSAVSTDTLTISRAFAGTTNASHASGTTNVARFSIAHLDGAAYATSSHLDKSSGVNYIQIFEDTAEVSYIKEKINKYAIGSQLDEQVAKLIPQMMRHLDKTLFIGSSASGSSSVPFAMGGFKQYITDNTASDTATALTQKLFEDRVQAAWADGGNIKVAVCNDWGVRKIRSLYEGMVRTTNDETRGGIAIDTVRTFAGDIDVLLDRWCPAGEMYFLDTDYVGIYELQPWMEEPVVSTAMTTRRRVWGAYSLVIKHDKAHALLYYSSSS